MMHVPKKISKIWLTQNGHAVEKPQWSWNWNGTCFLFWLSVYPMTHTKLILLHKLTLV